MNYTLDQFSKAFRESLKNKPDIDEKESERVNNTINEVLKGKFIAKISCHETEKEENKILIANFLMDLKVIKNSNDVTWVFMLREIRQTDFEIWEIFQNGTTRRFL